MANQILLKRSATANAVPLAANVALGELVINTTDGNLFYKNTDGNVTVIASNKFLSVTGNITGGNLNAAGLSLSGNVLSNINSTSNITTTANISGNYFIGNGSLLTGIDATSIQNGNSNVKVYANANVATSVNGVANVLVVTDTGLNITGLISANGNVTGGNILTAGLISAGSNITGGNLITAGAISAASVSASGNVTGGNILTAGLISAGSNITGANIDTAGLISAGGNITGGNLITAGAISAASVSASGNVTAGNIITSGASGNISGANVISGVTLSASGNITGGNLNAAGLSLSGNVVSALVSAANITTTANISGNYFIGNGSLLTGIDTTSIQNGNSNVKVYANANVATSVNGVANVLVITDTGLNITGLISANGNVTGGNVITAGAISAASVSASGNVTGGNVLTGGLISATGNITANANISAANFLTAGLISATGNVTGGNVNTNVVVGTALTLTSTGALNLSATGNVVLNNVVINGLATPSQDQDAANKAYVDSVAQGLDVKASVEYATYVALPAYTYNNGTSGVGATITADANGALSIDGSAPSVGARVLVKNETASNAPYNGIYVVTVAGSAGTAFVLTRSTDFDNGSPSGEIPGAFTFVEAGTNNADTGWVCTTNAPVTVGTTNIVFAQFSGAGQYTANTSAGLSLTGTVFSAKVDENTTAFDGGGNIIVKASANLTTPNIGAATGTSLSASGNVTGGNLITAGAISAASVSASGNITAGNIITSGASGNISGANVISGTTFSASANITGGNLITAGAISAASVSASGNVTGGNILTGGLISATANISGTNVYSGGNLVLTVESTVDGGTY
jgi:hypothetical protein